jgi:hypothetical protein
MELIVAPPLIRSAALHGPRSRIFQTATAAIRAKFVVTPAVAEGKLLRRLRLRFGPLVLFSSNTSNTNTDSPPPLEARRPRIWVFDAFEDVSNRAAHELGRLMLLHDPTAARQLYNWTAEQEQIAWDKADCDHLPVEDANGMDRPRGEKGERDGHVDMTDTASLTRRNLLSVGDGS